MTSILKMTALFVSVMSLPGAVGASEEVERYVAAVQSVPGVKQLLGAHLNAECGTGSCVDNNAAEVCNLVGALDVRVGGAIINPSQPAQPSTISIEANDLQLMRRIWKQCKPTNDGYWRHGVMLRVTYQGDAKEVASVLAALRGSGGRNDATRAVAEEDNFGALSSCLLERADRGAYSSFDGGRSAVEMLKLCQSHVSRWVDSCVASGQPRSGCLNKALIAGQAALKMAGK